MGVLIYNDIKRYVKFNFLSYQNIKETMSSIEDENVKPNVPTVTTVPLSPTPPPTAPTAGLSEDTPKDKAERAQNPV